MATIVQEDGTGLANANSYATEAELSTYATDRGVTISGTAAVLLIQAMDYIEQMDFIGSKYSSTQALVWPRVDVVIDGYSVEYSTIPQLLKDAQMEVCVAIDGGNNPLSNVSRETIREKVGELEVEYKASALFQTYLRAVQFKLKKLLKSTSLGVVRG